MEKLYSIKHNSFDYWNPVRGILKECSVDIVIANTEEDAERAFLSVYQGHGVSRVEELCVAGNLEQVIAVLEAMGKPLIFGTGRNNGKKQK
ncbi:MAG: hypothetical protein PHO02_02900 [Candidatus Nanoarchaeia archaeon]|nr:hypothetical protein [Candidatus Nanoarchaeia archaeon]